jgi:hypothetical protein
MKFRRIRDLGSVVKFSRIRDESILVPQHW